MKPPGPDESECQPDVDVVLAPKRGCLKSGTFFVSPDFNEAESGFESFFRSVDLNPFPPANMD